MTLVLDIIALIVAISLSGIAAFFSVIGLTAIFAGATTAVIVLGGALELGKVVTATWTHINWKKIGVIPRIYLSVAVLVLMAITSMGIFGLLSSAYIEHNVKIDQAADTSVLALQIKTVEQKLETVNTRIGQHEKVVSGLIDRKEVKTANKYLKDNKKEMDDLTKERDDLSSKLAFLKAQMTTSNNEVTRLEAEVGPIKYLANIWYGDAQRNDLDRAVTILIVLLVLVFDPLALMLTISAVKSITERGKKAEEVKEEPKAAIEPVVPSKPRLVAIAQKDKGVTAVAKEELVKKPATKKQKRKYTKRTKKVELDPNAPKQNVVFIPITETNGKKSQNIVEIPEEALIRL